MSDAEPAQCASGRSSLSDTLCIIGSLAFALIVIIWSAYESKRTEKLRNALAHSRRRFYDAMRLCAINDALRARPEIASRLALALAAEGDLDALAVAALSELEAIPPNQKTEGITADARVWGGGEQAAVDLETAAASAGRAAAAARAQE